MNAEIEMKNRTRRRAVDEIKLIRPRASASKPKGHSERQHFYQKYSSVESAFAPIRFGLRRRGPP